MYLFACLSIFFAICLYFRRKYSYWDVRGIRGPPPVYLFGNTIDEYFDDPNKKEIEYLRKYGSFFGTYRGLKPVFNTSIPEHIKQILNNPNIFHSLGNFEFYDNYFSHSVLYKNGKDWKKGRKTLTHYFTGAKIKSLLDKFDFPINVFFENVESDQLRDNTDSIDFKVLTAYMCIDMISKILLSFDINSYVKRRTLTVQHFLGIIKMDKVQTIFACILPQKMCRFCKITGVNMISVNVTGDMFKKMYEQRKLNKEIHNDLIDSVKEANEKMNLGFNDNEIIGNSIISYLTGVNPISDALCSVMYQLIKNPNEKQKLIEEIEKEFSDGIEYEKLVDNAYLHAVIKESLRLIVSNRTFTRTAMVDTVIGGIKIEKGTEVKAISWIPNNSEEYFPNPEKFDPNRFLDKSTSNPNIINSSTYLPFGDGPKACIGKRFSLVFMKYFLVKFFLKYDIYKPNNFIKQIFSSREFSTYNSFIIGLKKKNKVSSKSQ